MSNIVLSQEEVLERIKRATERFAEFINSGERAKLLEVNQIQIDLTTSLIACGREELKPLLENMFVHCLENNALLGVTPFFIAVCTHKPEYKFGEIDWVSLKGEMNGYPAKDAQQAILNREQDALTIHQQLQDARQQLADAQAKYEKLQESVDTFKRKLVAGIELNKNFSDTYYVAKTDALTSVLRQIEALKLTSVTPPAFKVGDNVRVIERSNDAEGIRLFYSKTPYDTITSINGGLYQLRYGADGSLGRHSWESHNLKPYVEGDS